MLLCRSLLRVWLAALAGVATAGAAEKWLQARSPHFEMFSAAGERDSRELLSSLELFRHVILEALGAQVERNPPTTIVVFKWDRDFDAYKPLVNGKPANLAGVCLNHPDGTFIAMAGDRDSEQVLRTIYHEYVHQLVGALGMNPPAWLNEGWAEVFETFGRRKGSVVLGLAHDHHVALLSRGNLMPLPRLMAVTRGSPDYTEGNRQGQFYATSWALVHYCLFGQSDLPRGALGRVMQRLEQHPNAPLEAVFQECFGQSVEEMERRLRRYLAGGRYTTATTKIPETWPGQHVDFAPADPFAVELALLQIRGRIRRDPAAAYLTRQLLEQRPEDPRPYELLGALARRDGESALALDHWTEAVARGSDNAYLHLAVVERELGQWLRAPSLQQTIPDEPAARWRSLLGRALAIDPGDQRAIYWLGWVEACARTPDADRVAQLEAAVPTQRRRIELFLNLALLRWRAGDEATARQIVQAIAAAPLDRGEGLRRQLAAKLGVALPAEAEAEAGRPMRKAGGPPIRVAPPRVP